MQHLQDTDIISLVLNGDQKPFSVLVDRYQHFVFTISMRYVENREEAEEIAQDVFMKAYRSLAGFNGKSKFSTWLYAIAHHTCLSHLRKRKTMMVSVDAHPAIENTLLAAEKASDKINTNSTRNLLDKAMSRLDKQDAEILTLFYQAEQSLEEIATITGQTPNNVKVRLFRARQRLKNILEQYYPADAVALK
ncbi:RNA polymerase sigma factor [Polluticoccus soli]|uniref:RNA polymerase sigma factor n=1 Tax=Polluticoccus soli TaxID=3034150 RepID=UPI0023E0CE8C|nr:sigma-70 family RNA polymerase sigma factor [Flavipsychrobacter sp. JY13-12]